MLLSILLISVLPTLASSWMCILIQTKALYEGVQWMTQNCTQNPDLYPPILVVNSITIDLSSPNIRVRGAIADPIAQVQPLPDMATQNPSFIAGINGGYFWRVDIDGFWHDNVCKGKTRAEAEQPASSENPNFGIGDGLVKVDGVVYSNNCNCTGYSRPAVLKIDGTNTGIEVLHRGETVSADVENAFAAGPNLVSYDATTGKSYVDIPDDDDNINRLVYEATTAVGVQLASEGGGKTVAKSMTLVTTDGSDSCLPNEHYCGLIAPRLASLMSEVFHLSVAMSMDQGGSTTMWIKVC